MGDQTSVNAMDQLSTEASTIMENINASSLNDEQLENLVNLYITNTQERERLLEELRTNVEEKYDITERQAEEYRIVVNYINKLEQQITIDKVRIKELNNLSNKKEKDLKIVNYYKKYYNAWRKIAFLIFIAVLINCILLLLINFLFNKFGGEQLWIQILVFLPGLAIAVSIYLIYLKSVDYLRRDDNVFDEYDYGNNLLIPTAEPTAPPQPNPSTFTLYDDQDPDTVPSIPTSNNIMVMNPSLLTELLSDGGILSCRDGYTFDENTFRCIPDSEAEANSNTDGFRNIKNFEGFQSNNYSKIGIC